MAKRINLRKEAEGRECQVRMIGGCNRDDMTVVLAHLRMAGITGVAQKAPDILGAWACSECHRLADQHSGDDQILMAFYEGIFRTIYELIKEGKIGEIDLPKKAERDAFLAGFDSGHDAVAENRFHAYEQWCIRNGKV